MSNTQDDTDLDKLMDDIYQCGRTDATLGVDDYNNLKPGMKAKLAALVARREATLARKILDQGHNLDCMFCGFKDKVATAALTTEATQGGKGAE